MANIREHGVSSYSTKELKKIMPTVRKIESYRDEYSKLSNDALRAKTDEFKKRLKEGETLDDILPEAYAVVREASKRVLGMEHYEVQLIGGIVLHQGRIAEMKTGEGKTLVATLPSYLNALKGEGVHIVTVNDYLANRDATEMGQIHNFLGLSVGVILHDMKDKQRRDQYNCDITYVTNNELGFDYLRDNMAMYKEQQVLRGLKYAIIDEVDSILIDEARTPLIISGQSGKSTKLYELCDVLVRRLERGEFKGEMTKIKAIMQEVEEEDGDYVVDEKNKIVNLTEEGVRKVEQFFHIDNYADVENLELQHNVTLALRAHSLMTRDKDYVVKDGEVLIVDEFTGRIMPGRRYSDGLHQAIEAKEHVEIKRESKTLATITFQNFFNKYDKKSGMTGTAMTEDKEFKETYQMDIVEIPTNKPILRVDLNDAVYKTKRGKFNAVINSIVESHSKGQPVLVGTISIETSEYLHKLLEARGIKHNVLNAKYHELEAQIVAEAGKHGAVTIATNMAGRGTDIKLDDEARAAGGLKIIGTERHESRRIDNQLRGRSGRQGDPGESRFYISLEDDLMRLFGQDRLMKIFNALGVDENMELDHKMLTNAIERAQKKIETNNYGIRSNLLKYDSVMNEQREIIYNDRNRVLDGEDMHDSVVEMYKTTIDYYIDNIIKDKQAAADWDYTLLNEHLLPIIPLDRIAYSADIDTKDKLKKKLFDEAIKTYESKAAEFENEEQFKDIERVIILRAIDDKWNQHIDDMDQLKQGIGLQAFAQRDPVVEYKNIGYDIFDDMLKEIQIEVVHIISSVRPKKEVELNEANKMAAARKENTVSGHTPVRVNKEKELV
ncbi:preprotein translocase subunit SecA [Howardella ureilytica]